MAASDVDQRILGRLCQQAAASNPLLSSALHQVLGLSVMLSLRLVRARKLRKLDQSRDTKSVSLYHHIFWLSREGLSITELYILPYCHDGEQSRECSVMAAKLRASFFHLFCLYHNHPPIAAGGTSPPSGVLTPRADNGQTMPRLSSGKISRDPQSRKAALRDTIPSMTSESSYITNPYALGGPGQTPPPAYPAPPIPSGTPAYRQTPTRPPGLGVPSPVQLSPPSSATYLMPPVDYVPVAVHHFSAAAALAGDLLPGSSPLRLSVALEHAAFLWDCTQDFEAARRRARNAVREVYAAPEGMDDFEFDDAAALVHALGVIAMRTDRVSTTMPLGKASGASSTSPISKDTGSRTDTLETLNTPHASAAHLQQHKKAAVQVGETELAAASGAQTAQDRPLSTNMVQQQRTRGQGTQRSRSPGGEMRKERKRRLVERAEAEIKRRNSAKSGSTAGGSKQATPPHMIVDRGKGRQDAPERFQ